MLNKKILFKQRLKSAISLFLKASNKDTIEAIDKSDVLLYCHDSNRGINLKNKPYSPLIDSLKDEFESQGYSCITIATPISKFIGNKGYGNPVAINRGFLINYGLNYILKYLGYKPLVAFYEKLFKKADPKFIISIGCNDSFCEAARNLGIFHAELLHGIGYTPIPWGWDEKEKLNLPQCILTLDPVSTHTFSNLSDIGVTIKEIQHPFLKRFDELNIDRLPKEWLPVYNNKSEQKEILISLQWGHCYEIDGIEIYKDIVENGLFPKELEHIINLNYLNVLWRFRLHPVLFRQPKKYKKLLDYINDFVESHSNCEILESTYLPLPAILSSCSGHITLCSMVSYEAAYLGVPSLALSPILRDCNSDYYHMFDDLVESKHLLKVEPNIDFIINWLQSVKKTDPLLNIDNIQEEPENLLHWLLEQTRNNI